MGHVRGVNAPIGGIRQFSHELLQVHVEIHKSASSHPLGPQSIGAVFYLYPDRNPASPALAGARAACRDQFSPGGGAAGSAAVNITVTVMFGNRNELFYFGLQ